MVWVTHQCDTMAPAVCILNPFNGTHNCRPGGGLRWVRSPTAAHRSKHALARSSNYATEPHPKTQVRLATAGRLRSAVALELVAGKVWALLDAVQPLVGSTAATARVHPAWVRRHGPCAPVPLPTTLAEGRRCLGVGPTRNPVFKGPAQRPPSERRRGGPASWTQSPGTTPPTA